MNSAFGAWKVGPLAHLLPCSSLPSSESGMTISRGTCSCGSSPGPPEVSHQEGKICLPELLICHVIYWGDGTSASSGNSRRQGESSQCWFCPDPTLNHFFVQEVPGGVIYSLFRPEITINMQLCVSY